MVRVDAGVSGSQAGNWTYNPRCGSASNSAGISHTCPLTVTNTGESLEYAVYFNPLATTATTTITAHTEMEDALLSLIDNAATSIDIALYGLDRQSVVSALIAAHTQGVTVRVVGDDEAATVSYVDSYQALVDAGIPIVIDSSLSQIQHNKFLIVDGQVVWTGSTNFTDTGFTLNANNSIVITSTALAGVYTLEFEEMWAGIFHSAKTDNTPHLLDYNGAGVESYFSPTDLVTFEVWGELAEADESVHFAMFFWTDDVLTERTIERLQEGVEVYGVWDRLGAANVSSADEALCAAGAHIGIEEFAGKLHHKFAVIDVFGDDPVVILGSYNWTDAGAYDNDENTLIIHDADLALAYYTEWETLWDAIEDKCNSFSVYRPAAFK
jgi:phosphatidylserine/phosphatidylglycerophosphate/cardiolipin synthase-like enzyme